MQDQLRQHQFSPQIRQHHIDAQNAAIAMTSTLGCCIYNLYEAPAHGDLVLIERYADQASLERHRTSKHYLNYRAQLSPLLASPISVTVLAPLDEA